MYTIGEFAALGRVSARMLRHYDALGLLSPARVDPQSGYRYYADSQVIPLLRIAELRALGCSLGDAAEVLAAVETEPVLRDVLMRRRTELSASIDHAQGQLAQIAMRLRQLEGEPVSTAPLEYRRVEPVTVYALSGTAPGMGPENVSPVVDELLGRLRTALDAAGVEYLEPGVFWYDPIRESDHLRVSVSWTAGESPRPGDGYEVVELPEIERAAVLQYRGSPAGIGTAWHELVERAVAAGDHVGRPTREVYLETEPRPESEWLTELIVPVTSTTEREP